MQNRRRGREPLFTYDHKLQCKLCNMNHNLGIDDDGPKLNISAPVDAHGQLLPDDPCENQQRGQNPAQRPQEYCRCYDNIVDSDEPLVLSPLLQGHTVVVASSLLQMIIARGLFSGLPSEDPYCPYS